MRIGIQLPIINTDQGAVWGDEVMAIGLAAAFSKQEGVSLAEIYDPVTLHDNLDVVVHLYPFPILRYIEGPRHYWWYQARVDDRILADPGWTGTLSLYDGFFAAGPSLREHLAGWGVPPEKIGLMPMSCDLNKYSRRTPDPDRSHDVVFCGNGGIRPRAAIQRYLLPLKDLGLKIFGSNWENHPELAECVEGPIPPSEVPSLYSSAKVVVSTHTSWHAANDLPTSRLWEALGCEAIVVSDRVPFAESLFGDAVVWSEGFADITRKVSHLLSRPDAGEKLRGKGREIIGNRLSFQAYAPRLVKVFRTGCMEDILTLKGGDDTMMKSGEGKGSAIGGMGRQCSSSTDWNQRGEEAFASGNKDEARRCFEKALQIDPFHAKVHSNLSVIHWESGEVEEALNRLSRALELDPDDQDVILNCANIFQALGKTDDAKDILSAYLDRKPWDQQARAQLEDLDKPPQAMPSFDPADFFNEQGETQFERGKQDHARMCFEMALENNPSHAGAHSNLGVIYWQAGDLGKALEHFNQALDLNPQDPEILLNSSRALVAAGEADAAADVFRFYLRQYPDDETAWEEYGSLLQEMGASPWKPDGLDSQVADIYLRTGQELSRAGDVIGAAEALQRVVKLDPNRVEAFYRLSRLHADLGQKGEAVEMLREGLKIDPAHKESVLAAGEVLRELDLAGEARAIYEAALAGRDDADIRAALDALTKLA